MFCSQQYYYYASSTMAKAIHRDNISITCSLMPNWRVNKEVVEISKMQMYQGIVKVLCTFHFRLVFMQIEYRNVLTKVEIYVSTRPPHLSHVNFSKIYILLSWFILPIGIRYWETTLLFKRRTYFSKQWATWRAAEKNLICGWKGCKFFCTRVQKLQHWWSFRSSSTWW